VGYIRWAITGALYPVSYSRWAITGGL